MCIRKKFKQLNMLAVFCDVRNLKDVPKKFRDVEMLAAFVESVLHGINQSPLRQDLVCPYFKYSSSTGVNVPHLSLFSNNTIQSYFETYAKSLKDFDDYILRVFRVISYNLLHFIPPRLHTERVCMASFNMKNWAVLPNHLDTILFYSKLSASFPPDHENLEFRRLPHIPRNQKWFYRIRREKWGLTTPESRACIYNVFSRHIRKRKGRLPKNFAKWISCPSYAFAEAMENNHCQYYLQIADQYEKEYGVKYVMLDDEERKRFAAAPFESLISCI